MCRAWPGFHCSNHPSDKVRKLSRQLHNLETQKEKIAEEQNTYRSENPDTWENSEEDKAFVEQLNKLTADIDTIEQKRRDEMTEFYATPAGKKVLEEAIANQERPVEERFDSAVELAAADARKLRQKKLAKTLQDPKALPLVKASAARMELKRSERELKQFNARVEELQKSLSQLQDDLYLAKATGNEAEVKRITEERNDYVKELAFIDKQRKQLESHILSTRQWLKRFTQTFVSSKHKGLFDLNEKLIAGFFKYLV